MWHSQNHPIRRRVCAGVWMWGSGSLHCRRTRTARSFRKVDPAFRHSFLSRKNLVLWMRSFIYYRNTSANNSLAVLYRFAFARYTGSRNSAIARLVSVFGRFAESVISSSSANRRKKRGDNRRKRYAHLFGGRLCAIAQIPRQLYS